MTSFFGLLAVFLLLWLALSNSGMKSRLKSLEYDLRIIRNRLEQLERWKDSSGNVAPDQPEVAAEQVATKVETTRAEGAAPAVKSEPEHARPAGTGKKPTATSGPPRAFVFTGALLQQFGQWLRHNWTIALAALSLALGGIFMVQYGVENGLLTPFWRVAGALALGGILVGAGEVIRRRYGDEVTEAARYLPSAFSGAGLITLFSAVLAARILYELVSPETTLAGLVLVSVLAVALGWLYGSVLSAVGIIGATAAPFLVGGESDSSWLFFYYFALVAIAGLAVDSVKRWAWVSAVVLIATVAAATMLYVATGGVIHYMAFLGLSWLAAIVIPVQNFIPSHAGQTVLATLSGCKPRADFPTRIVAAMTLFVSGTFVFLSLDADTATEANISLVLIALVLGATLIWMHRAEALKDIPLLPAVAFLSVLVLQAVEFGPLFGHQAGMTLSHVDIAARSSASFFTYVLILSVIASFMAFWRMSRSQDDARTALGFALGAASFAPATALILEFLWSPAAVLGDYVWSLHILAVSVVLTLLTDRVLRGEARAGRQLHAALFAIAALSMLALALFIVLTQTALTLALSVVVVLTIWLDRRFDLALIGIFTKLALAVVAFRLVANPGFFWAVRANTSWLTFLEAYLGTCILLYVGWKLTVLRARQSVQVAIETTTWTIAAVFACALLQRLVPDQPGLLAAVLAIAMLAQLNRLQSTGKWLRLLRGALALFFGLVATALISVPVTISNPLLSRFNPVKGPLIFDTLALSYLPLAAVLAFGAWKVGNVARCLRIGFIGISSLLAGFYVICEIRRFWRGSDLAVPGITQPELYSYTIALVILCIVLLMVSFSRRSHVLRKVAMAATGLTIAKVFLVDISGLEGLLRVVSFIGLGLALAGLGWLDRSMKLRWSRVSDQTEKS